MLNIDKYPAVQLKFNFPKYWVFYIRVNRARLAAVDWILAEDFFNDITKCLQNLKWTFDYREDEKIQILGYTPTNSWFCLAFNDIDLYIMGVMVAENFRGAGQELDCLERILMRENERYYLAGPFDFHSMKE
ncbi:hypothetical protein HYT57_05285 [Candidatus Woesearchaeota archaeon]|nr:hypothetical protein [Candidatus Woesearchaeota archaeon]